MESLNSTLPSTFNIPVAYLKNYSQQLMKIWGDKTNTLNSSDLLCFQLPNTVIDLKTLNFIFEFTTSAVETQPLMVERLTLLQMLRLEELQFH
jgi:hypothetical protein